MIGRPRKIRPQTAGIFGIEPAPGEQVTDERLSFVAPGRLQLRPRGVVVTSTCSRCREETYKQTYDVTTPWEDIKQELGDWQCAACRGVDELPDLCRQAEEQYAKLEEIASTLCSIHGYELTVSQLVDTKRMAEVGFDFINQINGPAIALIGISERAAEIIAGLFGTVPREAQISIDGMPIRAHEEPRAFIIPLKDTCWDNYRSLRARIKQLEERKAQINNPQ